MGEPVPVEPSGAEGNARARGLAAIVACAAIVAALGGYVAGRKLEVEGSRARVEPSPVARPAAPAATRARREEWERGFDRALALVLRRRHLELVDEMLRALPLPAAGAPDPALAADLDEWSLLRRERRDLDGANALVAQARALDPDPERARLRDRIVSEDVTAVRELARDPAIEAWPASSLRLLGRALDCAGADDAAERLFVRALGRFPDDFDLRLALADLLFREGPDAAERARTQYGAAQALRPGSLRAALHHAWLLCDDDPSAAIAVMAAACRRAPDEAVAAWAFGAVLFLAGHVEEGRTRLERALELDPRFALAPATIGETWLDEPEFERAEAAFDASLALADTPEAADGLAMKTWSNGSLERASTLLEDAVLRHPYDALLRNHLADSLQQRGRSRDALMNYRESVHLDEWIAETQNDYAWELVNSADARLRRPGQALEHVQRACDMEPENANYRNTLGITWYRLGNFQNCIAELELACELPGGGGALDLFFLAMAKEQQGDHADALDCFARASARMDESDDEHVRALEEAKELIGAPEDER